MASGLSNKLVGQTGEFLVCAELGRRGFIATPFSGNVPGYDVVVLNPKMRAVPLQVKTSNGGDFPFDLESYCRVEFDDKRRKQYIVGNLTFPNPGLLHVFVWLGHLKNAPDRYFICRHRDVQRLVKRDASKHLKKHNNHRPNNWRSTSGHLRCSAYEKHEGRWESIDSQL